MHMLSADELSLHVSHLSFAESTDAGSTDAGADCTSEVDGGAEGRRATRFRPRVIVELSVEP